MPGTKRKAADTRAKHHEDNLLDDLIVSMIAVNNYSLKKAWSLRDGLRAQQLLDLKALSQFTEDEIYERLGKAGYKYIPYVQRLLAQRLVGMSRELSKRPDALARAGSKARPEEALQELGRLPGIGPKVAENFLMLTRNEGSSED